MVGIYPFLYTLIYCVLRFFFRCTVITDAVFLIHKSTCRALCTFGIICVYLVRELLKTCQLRRIGDLFLDILCCRRIVNRCCVLILEIVPDKLRNTLDLMKRRIIRCLIPRLLLKCFLEVLLSSLRYRRIFQNIILIIQPVTELVRHRRKVVGNLCPQSLVIRVVLTGYASTTDISGIKVNSEIVHRLSDDLRKRFRMFHRTVRILLRCPILRPCITRLADKALHRALACDRLACRCFWLYTCRLELSRINSALAAFLRVGNSLRIIGKKLLFDLCRTFSCCRQLICL